MPQPQTLSKPYHYWVEVLDKNDDRISCAKVFKRPMALHEWCQSQFARSAESAEIHRIQVWYGSADPDNPDVDADWVNSYSREPFVEFGHQSIKINRSGKATQITGAGEVFVHVHELPPIYTLAGRWYKPTQRKGKGKKRRKTINLEAIA